MIYIGKYIYKHSTKVTDKYTLARIELEPHETEELLENMKKAGQIRGYKRDQLDTYPKVSWAHDPIEKRIYIIRCPNIERLRKIIHSYRRITKSIKDDK